MYVRREAVTSNCLAKTSADSRQGLDEFRRRKNGLNRECNSPTAIPRNRSWRRTKEKREIKSSGRFSTGVPVSAHDRLRGMLRHAMLVLELQKSGSRALPWAIVLLSLRGEAGKPILRTYASGSVELGAKFGQYPTRAFWMALTASRWQTGHTADLRCFAQLAAR